MDYRKLCLFLVVLLAFERPFLQFLADPDLKIDLNAYLAGTLVYLVVMSVFWGAIGYLLCNLGLLIYKLKNPDKEMTLTLWQKVCIGLGLGLIGSPFITQI